MGFRGTILSQSAVIIGEQAHRGVMHAYYQGAGQGFYSSVPQPALQLGAPRYLWSAPVQPATPRLDPVALDQLFNVLVGQQVVTNPPASVPPAPARCVVHVTCGDCIFGTKAYKKELRDAAGELTHVLYSRDPRPWTEEHTRYKLAEAERTTYIPA